MLILFLQLANYAVKRSGFGNEIARLVADSVMEDELTRSKSPASDPDLKPFNPNYISDFKGYLLGMQPQEIDRLKAFRDKGSYVNNAAEFQKVTGVKDSLLNRLAPYFKFPNRGYSKQGNKTARRISVFDINKANAADFQKVRGIGPVLSKRIIKFRNRLGGFLSESQLYDVYGLPPETADRTIEYFKVLGEPTVPLLNINESDYEELGRFIYFSKEQAMAIWLYRQENGPIDSLDELKGILGITADRFERIRLYLRL